MISINWHLFVPLMIGCQLGIVYSDIDYNTINEDGSYQFRHSNDDIGGYYHTATGTPDNIVRGRYGSRNPASGQVEEVVYTAGPRGFRVNGPKIHRKMDLAQYPPRPIGSPDDPLADPFDDPSYSFNYRTPDQSRTENNDRTNRVRGLYSFIDDVGERHSVRYAAGAGTGFEISNAVPDNPSSVGYTAPLYKSHPRTRGRMAVQRGPNGSYKLILAGPDHRRAESRGTDGLVRGTYSFLDDKGIQRTVEYIAGAGIGYRIVQNLVGPGTHINPSVSDFRLSDTDFRLANEYGRGAGGSVLAGGRGTGTVSSLSSSSSTGGEYLKTSGSGRIGPKYNQKSDTDFDDNDNDNINENDNDNDNGRYNNGGDTETENDQPSRRKPTGDRNNSPAVNRGSTRFKGSTSKNSGSSGSETNVNRNKMTSFGNGKDSSKKGGGGSNRGTSDRDSLTFDIRSSDKTRYRGGSSSSSSGYNYGSSASSSTNYNLNDDDVGSLPPLITANRKILEIDRERDWVERHRDSTVIKNVGKWYIGLPPGQSVRAHVQNIDLVPLGGRRIPSPSEALRADEIADMIASKERGVPYSS